jgi:voltage-gated sodium channel
MPESKGRLPREELGPAASRALRIIERPWFRRAVLGLIIFASALVGVETYGAVMERFGPFLKTLDRVVVALFVVEIAIRLVSYGRAWPRFFTDPWNVFDFVIVAACLVPVDSQAAAALRLVRVLRALRLLTAIPQLQVVIGALLRSLPSIGYVGMLLVLLFYVYAVIGTTLFGANDPAHFGTLHDACLSLLRAVTLEDWTDLMYTQIAGSEAYPGHLPVGVEPVNQPRPIVAVLYFGSFVLVGTMIMLNLFIGVVIGALTEEQKALAQEAVAAGMPSDPDAQLRRIEAHLDNVRDEIRVLSTAIKDRPLHLVHQRRQHAGPARADRVAERDAAAAEVHLVLGDAQRLDVAEDLRRERLVDLEQVDVLDGPCPPSRALCGCR